MRQPDEVVVLGHAAGDVDSIISTILMQDYLRCKGIFCRGAIIGPAIDAWTKSVLRWAGIFDKDLPQYVTVESLTQSCVFLVDHGMPSESFGTNSPPVSIVGVVDHHNRGCVEPQAPPAIKLHEPLAPSCSVLIWQLMKSEASFRISPHQLKLILIALAVDSVCGLKYVPERFQSLYPELLSQVSITHEDMLSHCTMDVDVSATPEFLSTYGSRNHILNGHNVSTSYAEVFRPTEERNRAIERAHDYLVSMSHGSSGAELWLFIVRDFSCSRTTVLTAGTLASGNLQGPIILNGIIERSEVLTLIKPFIC